MQKTKHEKKTARVSNAHAATLVALYAEVKHRQMRARVRQQFLNAACVLAELAVIRGACACVLKHRTLRQNCTSATLGKNFVG